MRKYLMIVTAGTALVAAGCGDNHPSSTVAASPAPAVATPPAASAANPSKPNDTVEPTLVVSGPLIVEHQIDVTAQRDGVVAKIFFDAASRVNAGTLLAQLDDRQIAANLAAARAKSRSIAADLKNWEAEAQVLKADYGRQQELWKLGLTSAEQLQHAQYKAESDQWDVKRVTELLNTSQEEERSLELELEKTKIVAPFGGLVARRYIREGQNVAKGDRLFWVTAEAPLLMRFTLPEKYFGRYRHGQQLQVTSADAPGEAHTARIREVSPVVDPASGTFEVLAELVGERGAFRPGMTASVHLESPR